MRRRPVLFFPDEKVIGFSGKSNGLLTADCYSKTVNYENGHLQATAAVPTVRESGGIKGGDGRIEESVFGEGQGPYSSGRMSECGRRRFHAFSAGDGSSGACDGMAGL